MMLGYFPSFCCWWILWYDAPDGININFLHCRFFFWGGKSCTFEYEKGLNMKQVKEMQEMEKNLVALAREVEKLRAEVLNAEKRAHSKLSLM